MAKSPKLSPQTELSLPPCTAVLPTTIGSSGYILMVSCTKLVFFYTIILTTSNFFHVKVTGLVVKSPKLSPQTEFGISLCTAVLPTIFGSDGYINRGELHGIQL
eukprot:CCRYP_004073-RB/>CCRYP_004073-RB protein AED:0.29 eAED:0.29 QI:187/1/0.5/1/0/0/2/0/103